MGTKGMNLGGRHKNQLPSRELSPKQWQVLGMIAQGLTDRQIGVKLGNSMQTIKHHSNEIRWRLEAKNRAEAVALGIREGLI